MPKLSRLVAVLVTGAVAGCGGGSSGGGSPTAPTPTPTPAAVSVTLTLQVGPATASTAADGFEMSSNIERLIRVQGSVAAANGSADITGTCSYPGSDELRLFEPIQLQPGAPQTIDEVFRLRQPSTGGPFGSGTLTCSVTGRGQDGTAVAIERTLPFVDSDVFVDPAPCVADDTTMCVNNDRFKVTVRWFEADGTSRPMTVVTGQRFSDGGFFAASDPSALDVFIQMQDRCAQNNHFWVFASSATNVEFTLRVLDTSQGITREYRQPAGPPVQTIQDTSAFATCP